MNETLKIIGIIGFVIILIIGGIYLYFRWAVKKISPKKPTCEVPITYNVGWWSNQNLLKIDDFSIEIEDSRLNLFNSKSLVSYTIKGKLDAKKGWKPYIKEVHISERIDNTITSNIIIEITPIVGLMDVNNTHESAGNFEFTNEHLVNSRNWGNNKFKFICEEFVELIEVHQSK